MAADAPYNREAQGAKPRSRSVGQPSASTGASLERPTSFEVIGDLSDEAIEALARLLLAVAEQDMAEVDTPVQEPRRPKPLETTV